MNVSRAVIQGRRKACCLIIGAIGVACLLPPVAEAVPPRFYRAERRAMRRMGATAPARPPVAARQLAPVPEPVRPQAQAVQPAQKKAPAEAVQQAGYEESAAGRSPSAKESQPKPTEQPKPKSQPQALASSQPQSSATSEAPVAADGTVSVLVRKPDAVRPPADTAPADAPLVFPDAAGAGQGR